MASLGLFTVASQFGDIADTIQTYINNAYGPWLFERLHNKSNGYKTKIHSVVCALCAIIGLFFICISLFSHDYILLFLNKKYIYSWKYVPLIVLVYGIKTMYYFYINILFYFKKASRILFTSTLTGSIINVFTSAILIPILGVYGSIIADAIAMLARVLIVYFISKRFENIGLKVIDFFKSFILIAFFVFLGLIPSYIYYNDKYNILNTVYKFIITSFYCIYIIINYKRQIIPLLNKIIHKQKCA